ncbi:MAG: hypothetical protein JRJ64_15940 [Deltaproteobacteria bacterium]|nr:hypothetical protein [Deltaproteobacteria bacterium]
MPQLEMSSMRGSSCVDLGRQRLALLVPPSPRGVERILVLAPKLVLTQRSERLGSMRVSAHARHVLRRRTRNEIPEALTELLFGPVTPKRRGLACKVRSPCVDHG